MGESHEGAATWPMRRTPRASRARMPKHRNAIRHQTSIEKAVLRSAAVLWTDTTLGAKRAAGFLPLLDQRATSLLNEVKAAYQLQAVQRNVGRRSRC